MAASMVLKTVFVVMVCMVVAAAPFEAVEAAISCDLVANKLIPCIYYLRGVGPLTKTCCDGVKALNAAASSTPDRQTACRCLKNAASAMAINLVLAGSLPGKCGVNFPYKISPSTDCAKVQ